ncbi:MAG: LEA type 2 family protein [Methanomassiliicoccales archaeon]|nr:LEA type 2 family protein [Methanomassiliicoccales archaeon]
MKMPLVVTRIAIVAIKLLVALIVVLSILPLIMGNLHLGLGSEEDIEWAYEDGSLRLTAPFTVDNRGFFDINGVTVDIEMRDQGGGTLIESYGGPMSAPAGRETELQVDIELDLDDLPLETLREMVFEGTSMDLSISISARYTMDLIRFGADIVSDMEWEAMLVDLDLWTEEAAPYYDGAQCSMRIPYSFFSRGWVQGEPVLVTVTFSDSYGYQGEFQELVGANDFVNREAYVPIPQETYDRLTMTGEELNATLSLTFLDCTDTVQENWWWSPW